MALPGIEQPTGGDRYRAIRDYLECYPDCGLAWGIMGEIRLESRDRSGAREAFEKAIQAEPHEFRWRLGLARSLDLREISIEEAWERIGPVPAIPEVAEAVINAFPPHWHIPLCREALDLARRIYLLQPQNPECGLLLANCLYFADRREEALRMYRSALLNIDSSDEYVDDPDWKGIEGAVLAERQHTQAAMALRALDRSLEAAAEFRHAIRIAHALRREPGRLDQNAARTFNEVGWFKEALEVCDYALAFEGVLTVRGFYELRTEALLKLGRVEEVTAAFQAALVESEADWVAVEVINLLRCNQRFDELCEVLAQCLAYPARHYDPEFPPLDSAVWLEVAELWNERGALPYACEAWKRAATSENPEVRASAQAQLDRCCPAAAEEPRADAPAGAAE